MITNFRNDDVKSKRQYLLYLAGGVCVKCGSSKQLEFDHIDSTTKKFMLTGSDLTRGMESIMAEFDKCQLLCALCHRKKTIIDRGFGHIPHGTVSRYINKKCRCDGCREANRDYSREYRRKHGFKRLNVAK